VWQNQSACGAALREQRAGERSARTGTRTFRAAAEAAPVRQPGCRAAAAPKTGGTCARARAKTGGQPAGPPARWGRRAGAKTRAGEGAQNWRAGGGAAGSEATTSPRTHPRGRRVCAAPPLGQPGGFPRPEVFSTMMAGTQRGDMRCAGTQPLQGPRRQQGRAADEQPPPAGRAGSPDAGCVPPWRSHQRWLLAPRRAPPGSPPLCCARRAGGGRGGAGWRRGAGRGATPVQRQGYISGKNVRLARMQAGGAPIKMPGWRAVARRTGAPVPPACGRLGVRLGVILVPLAKKGGRGANHGGACCVHRG